MIKDEEIRSAQSENQTGEGLLARNSVSGLRISRFLTPFHSYFREWSVALCLLALLFLLAVLAPGFFQRNQLIAILTAVCCAVYSPLLVVGWRPQAHGAVFF